MALLDWLGFGEDLKKKKLNTVDPLTNFQNATDAVNAVGGSGAASPDSAAEIMKKKKMSSDFMNGLFK